MPDKPLPFHVSVMVRIRSLVFSLADELDRPETTRIGELRQRIPTESKTTTDQLRIESST